MLSSLQSARTLTFSLLHILSHGHFRGNIHNWIFFFRHHGFFCLERFHNLIFPSRQFYFRRKDMRRCSCKWETHLGCCVIKIRPPEEFSFYSFLLCHLTHTFVFCNCIIVGSFVHPFSHQIGNCSLSFPILFQQKCTICTKSTKPYL